MANNLGAGLLTSSSKIDLLQKRIEYDESSNPIYVGTSEQGKADTDASWTIAKMTWSGSNMTLKQTACGAWSNRASLTYS